MGVRSAVNWLLLGATAALVASVRAEIATDGEVLVLTDDTFEQAITENEAVLVKYMTTWCGHCKNLAPAYKEAASALKAQGSKARLAEVDCTIHTKTCTKYDVKGYPTLKLFKGGAEAEKYAGQRTKDALVAYAVKAAGEAAAAEEEAPKAAAGPPATDGEVLVLTDDNFEQAIKDNKAVLVKYMTTWCGHCKNLAPAYKEAASALKAQGSKARLAEVDCTIHTKTCTKYDIKGYPTLKLFKDGAEAEKYAGQRTKDAFVEFAVKAVGEAAAAEEAPKAAAGPPATDDEVLVLTDDNFEAIKDNKAVLVKFFTTWCGHCKNLAPAYKEAASALKAQGSNARLAEVDCTVHTKTCTKYDVKGYPTLKLFKAGVEDKPYKGQRTKEAILAFMEEAAPADKHEEL